MTCLKWGLASGSDRHMAYWEHPGVKRLIYVNATIYLCHTCNYKTKINNRDHLLISVIKHNCLQYQNKVNKIEKYQSVGHIFTLLMLIPVLPKKAITANTDTSTVSTSLIIYTK